MSHYFKNIKYHGLLLKNPMGCYKNRPIWSFQSVPGVFEREFTVNLFHLLVKLSSLFEHHQGLYVNLQHIYKIQPIFCHFCRYNMTLLFSWILLGILMHFKITRIFINPGFIKITKNPNCNL